MSESTTKKEVIVVGEKKNMTIAILLSFFFGPLGMIYASISGAIWCFLISGVAAFFTMGLGLLVTWPLQLIWTAVAVNKHNTRIAAGIDAANTQLNKA